MFTRNLIQALRIVAVTGFACALTFGSLAAQDNATGEAQKENEPAKGADGSRIELQDDFQKAIKLAQLQQRPLLVVLGAHWCTWCRKLEAELVTGEATAILKKWIVVKIDVDAEPEIAQQMQANALPALRVLGADQAIVASKEGYMPIAELQAWLESQLPVADPATQRVLFESDAINPSDLAKLIEFLGHRSPSIRNAAQMRLSRWRHIAATSIVDTLRSGKLAQQLCAMQILQSWKAPVATIDPWQPESMDAAAIAPLVEWLKHLPEEDSANPVEKAELPHLDSQSANEWLDRLLNEATSSRPNLMADSIRIGPGLVPFVRMRLANNSNLDDSQRMALRELLYRLLAGNRTGLEHPSLLVALSSLDADMHRKAAEKLLEVATSQDQLLVDELSVDPDPLVRELTVSKLQSLGSLNESSQIQRLLADKSPSVRTAVLRELSDNPKDRAIEALIEYIDRETDEDLLVYATKTLGQLGSQSGAEEALCRLAKNPSWRVRAAFLDAIEQSQDEYSNRSSEVSVPIAQSVLRASQDSDAFVAEKAVPLIPKILSKNSAQLVGEYLIEHPDRLHEIVKDIDEDSFQKKFAPLVGHAEKWLKSDNAQSVRGATQIIARLKPELLRDDLPGLLESADGAIRLAAKRAFLDLMIQLRNEQLATGLTLWQSKMESFDAPDLWHEIPKELQSLPPIKAATQSINPAASRPDSYKQASGDSLSLVDDFFGGPSFGDPNAPKPTFNPASLDLITDLFGSDISPAKAKPTQTPAPAETQTETQASKDDSSDVRGFKQYPLSSIWLSEWHSMRERKGSINWVQNVQNALVSDQLQVALQGTVSQESESLWRQVDLLACGQADQVTDIAHQIQANPRDTQDSPKIADVLAWMPPKERLDALKNATVDWRDLRSSRVASLLEAATEIDDLKIADWIYLESTAANLDEAQLSVVGKFLLRALIGARADSISSWAVEGESPQNFSKPRKQSIESSPGVNRAIDWLAERYKATQNDWSKALLLMTVSYLDHPLAARSSLGIVAGATEYSSLTNVALTIALGDTSELSSDRAAQWLEHPLVEVQLASAKRLLMTNTEYAGESMEKGVVVAYDHNSTMLGLQEIRRDLPVAALTKLAQNDEPRTWVAKLLLMAAGEKQPLQDLLVGHSSPEDTLPIVAALAKAGRTDAEAIAFYTKASEQMIEYGQPSQLYSVLRSLKGSEITALRRRMREVHGAGLDQ